MVSSIGAKYCVYLMCIYNKCSGFRNLGLIKKDELWSVINSFKYGLHGWQSYQYGVTNGDDSFYDQGIGRDNPGLGGRIDTYNFDDSWCD